MSNRFFNGNILTRLLLITLIAGCFRMLFLDRYPSSLFIDEVSQGYNAYSLLTTGKDEFGVSFPLGIRAFGEWKPALVTYLMIPSIALFGLTHYGVRIMSAIAGTLTVPGIYFLVLEMFALFSSSSDTRSADRKRLAVSVGLVSAAILAVSPWHIVQSRAALHGAVAVFLLVWGLWAGLKMMRAPWYGIVAAVCFGLLPYAYFGMHLTLLLFALTLGIWFRSLLFQKRHAPALFVSGIVGMLLLFPLVYTAYKEPENIFGRARYISIFYDQGPALTIWNMISSDGPSISSVLVRFYHNKPHQYAVEFIRRFFHHLDLRFLFLSGPPDPPFKLPGMGILYLADGMFLLAGARYLARRQPELLKFLGLWIAIAILPAGLTFITPSANRIFPMVIPVAVITAAGFVSLVHRFPRAFFSVFLLYAISVGYFVYVYCVVMPKEHAGWWNGGYRELVAYLSTQEPRYKQITISGRAAGPYIFYLFYTKTDPALAQKFLERDLTKDAFGFEHVTSFRQYAFPRGFSWQTHEKMLAPGSLLAVTAGEQVGYRAHELHRILLPNGDTAFIVYVLD